MAIELRWVTYRRKTNEEQISKHADFYGLSLDAAKAKLEERTGPRLQYRTSRQVNQWTEWRDIPQATIMLPQLTEEEEPSNG